MESPINIFNINQEKPKKRKRVSATLNKAGKAITAVTNRLHQPSNIRQKLLGRQISEARTKQIDLDIEAMQKQFEATKQKSEYLSTLRTQRTNEKNNWKAVANHRELELQEKREKVIEQRYLHYDRLRLNTDRIINENLLAANETHLKTIQNRERKNKEKNEFLANVRIRRAMSKDFVKEIWFDKPTNYDGTTRERRVLQAYGIPKKVNSIK